MALMDDLAKGATPVNLVIGVGAGLLAPVLAPAVASILRPAAKAVLSTGIMLYRGTMEPLSAGVSSLVTEAQTELAAASAAGQGNQAAGTSDAAEESSQPLPRKRQRKADR